LQITTKIVSSHTADSKLVKQEVNGTVILPPLVFPGHILTHTNTKTDADTDTDTHTDAQTHTHRHTNR
jgi:hypothetical protein